MEGGPRQERGACEQGLRCCPEDVVEGLMGKTYGRIRKDALLQKKVSDIAPSGRWSLMHVAGLNDWLQTSRGSNGM